MESASTSSNGPPSPARDPQLGSIQADPSGTSAWILVWRFLAAAAAIWLLATFLAPGLVREAGEPDGSPIAWGWDETMHAELPAVQVLLNVERGEWMAAAEVIHECDRYPFVYPVLLAAWQGVFGIGETQARMLGRLSFVLIVLLTIPLAFYVARRPARLGARPRGVLIDVGLFVALVALSSPLARRYGPTLYLEVPAVAMIALTMISWLSRRDLPPGTRKRVLRDLLTGALAAVTFFTKFNYALLLAAALGADAILELVMHRGRRAAWWSLLRVAAPVLVGLAWWFLLPLPLGQEVAAEHRHDFAEFVNGNQEMGQMAAWLRKTNWLTGVAPHPLLFVVLVLSTLAMGLLNRTRTAMTFVFALAAFIIPIVAHNFQLDRFLLPAALMFWVVGGTYLALFLRRFPRTFSLVAVAVAGLCMALAPLEVLGWKHIGFPVQPKGTPVRALQAHHVHTTLGLYGPPASNGLPREAQDPLMDMLAEAVGPEDSVGWLGQSAEVSPASLHLELLKRGGSEERFLQYAAGPMDIVLLPSNVRVDFSAEELLDHARRFDHLVVPAQGDMIDRPGRRWIAEAWHKPLRESALIEWETLGSVLVERFNDTPLPVTIELARVTGGPAGPIQSGDESTSK